MVVVVAFSFAEFLEIWLKFVQHLDKDKLTNQQGLPSARVHIINKVTTMVAYLL